MVVLLVVLTFVAFIIIYPLVQKRRQRKFLESLGVAEPVLSGYMFTPGHLWLNLLTPGRYRLGLDELILRFMGNPDIIHLIEDGKRVEAGEPLAILSRRGKHICLRAPVAARIIKANQALVSQPYAVNLDPYRRGWLYLVELTDPDKRLRSLLTGDKARVWIKTELSRLKEFVVRNQQVPALTGNTLLDGGELIDSVIDHLDQIAVSDFEIRFLKEEFPELDEKKK